MRKSRFIKHINLLDEEELRTELKTLYAKLPEVRFYYAMELGSEEERKKLYDHAKKDIASKYATKSYRKPRRPRIQKINKILGEMRKKSIFSHEMIDLYLYDVECALTFMKRYGFFSEVLANHITGVFQKALVLVDELHLQESYKSRCGEILMKAKFSPGIYIDIEDYWLQVFKKSRSKPS